MKRKYFCEEPLPTHAITLLVASKTFEVQPKALCVWLHRRNILLFKKKKVYYVLPEWLELYAHEREKVLQKRQQQLALQKKIKMSEAASRLDMSRQALHQHLRQGHITGERIGGLYYVDFETIKRQLLPYRRKRVYENSTVS